MSVYVSLTIVDTQLKLQEDQEGRDSKSSTGIETAALLEQPWNYMKFGSNSFVVLKIVETQPKPPQVDQDEPDCTRTGSTGREYVIGRNRS